MWLLVSFWVRIPPLFISRFSLFLHCICFTPDSPLPRFLNGLGHLGAIMSLGSRVGYEWLFAIDGRIFKRLVFG